MSEKTDGYRFIENEEQEKYLGEEGTQKRATWGWFMPATAAAGYGARTIYRQPTLEWDRFGRERDVPAYVDVYADRAAFLEETVEGANDKLKKLYRDHKVIKKLEEFLTKHAVRTNDERRIYGRFGDLQVICTPNGSYGYIYFSAWVDEKACKD